MKKLKKEGNCDRVVRSVLRTGQRSRECKNSSESRKSSDFQNSSKNRKKGRYEKCDSEKIAKKGKTGSKKCRRVLRTNHSQRQADNTNKRQKNFFAKCEKKVVLWNFMCYNKSVERCYPFSNLSMGRWADFIYFPLPACVKTRCSSKTYVIAFSCWPEKGWHRQLSRGPTKVDIK